MPTYLAHSVNNLMLANHIICGQSFYDTLYIGAHTQIKVNGMNSLRVMTESSKKYAFGTKRLFIRGNLR